MRDFVFKGYIINVDGNHVTIRVDAEYIEKISHILILHNKKQTVGNFITINIKTCKFDITNLSWDEPKDLVGVHVEVTCFARVSEFYTKIKFPKDTYVDKSYICERRPIKLVSFVARTIENKE